jgi:hypothetical protein
MANNDIRKRSTEKSTVKREEKIALVKRGV